MRQTVFVLMIAIVMFTASSLPAQVLYDLIDLGEGAAYSINNSGQVVGTAGYELPDGSFALVPHAVLFDSTGDGNNIDLGEGTAYSINNSGQIVGQFGIFVDHQYAALFEPTGDGNNINVTILSNNGHSRASSINNSGQIVGSSGGAVLFDPTGDANNIDLDYSYAFGYAASINNEGQIVGVSLMPPQAILFDPTGAGDNLVLEVEGLSSMDSSWASSINDKGQVVGGLHHVSLVVPPKPGLPHETVNYQHAVLFDPTGDSNSVDLGTLPGGDHSNAYSINNNGQIVGYAYTSSDEKHAAMFDSTGGGDNIDLNELIDPALGWTLTEARCINDNGWIVGQMTNAEGDEHAFLLTPTPLKIAIDNIEQAIAEKLYALETIDIALEKEWAAVEVLDELLANGDFGDLNRRDILRAKFRIYRSVYRQMRSKAELRRSIKDLERSLELLNAN